MNKSKKKGLENFNFSSPLLVSRDLMTSKIRQKFVKKSSIFSIRLRKSNQKRVVKNVDFNIFLKNIII